MFGQREAYEINDSFNKRQKPRRPNASYAELITLAIERSNGGMLTLKEIYKCISDCFPYYELGKGGWQNSIRHNLSLNKSFYRVPKGSKCPGKGSYWKVNSDRDFDVAKRRKQSPTGLEIDSVKSLSDLLSGNKLLSDNLGVNEIPQKQTIFNGNLMDNDDVIFENHLDKDKFDHFFSFK